MPGTKTPTIPRLRVARLRVALLGAVVAALLATGAVSPPVRAEDSPAPAAGAPDTAGDAGEQARVQEIKAAFEAALTASTKGPADVAMIDQGVLRLPDGYVFIPKAEGARFLRALGNTVSTAPFVGLIMSTQAHWIITVDYIKDGYIKEDDAKNWNADELLQSLKDGTEASNADRAQRGFPELEIVRWIEAPGYDPETHRLIWSLLAKDKGEPDDAASTVNYNTYALGRDGYFSLDLLTSSEGVATDKKAAHEMLAALSYNSGRRYEDFNQSTDHIAEYGLLALVGGIAAKKLGLFAIIAAFVLKFAKVIAIAVFAGGASVWNFLRRRVKGGTS